MLKKRYTTKPYPHDILKYIKLYIVFFLRPKQINLLIMRIGSSPNNPISGVFSPILLRLRFRDDQPESIKGSCEDVAVEGEKNPA